MPFQIVFPKYFLTTAFGYKKAKNVYSHQYRKQKLLTTLISFFCIDLWSAIPQNAFPQVVEMHFEYLRELWILSPFLQNMPHNISYKRPPIRHVYMHPYLPNASYRKQNVCFDCPGFLPETAGYQTLY